MILEKLKDFQRSAVDFAIDRGCAALFCEQGTGKTWIAAGVVETLYKNHDFTSLIVVPLANIETTWARLLQTIPGLSLSRSWDEFQKSAAPRTLLLHYEALQDKKLARKILKHHWTLVIYDESQRLKARGSKQSRVAARFKSVDRRIILSGTPIEQCPQDLWAQFRFALPDVFGVRWADFKGRWLRETGFMGYELKFREELMPLFLKKIRPHIRRVLKGDVLDLPPLTYVRSSVDLLGNQAKAYRDVSRHMFAEVDGGTVTCDLAITQLIRQQQIVGGFVHLDPTEEGRRVAYLGSAKVRRLKRILKRVEMPVVIFCKYKEELRTIAVACEHMRLGIVSGKSRRTRVDTIDKFQRGELDVLICQIKAGGVGIDLFRASTAIFYSCTFSSIDFEQAVCRLHRFGQTRPVRIYLIQAANTVDKAIWTALLLKKSVTELILDRKGHHGKER